MNREQAQDWLNRYVHAWEKYDEVEIADLFADEARYRYHPYDKAVAGRAEIVREWLGRR